MREALAIRLELGESRVQVTLTLRAKLEDRSTFNLRMVCYFNFRFGFKIDEQNGANAKTPEKHRDGHLRVPIFYLVVVS